MKKPGPQRALIQRSCAKRGRALVLTLVRGVQLAEGDEQGGVRGLLAQARAQPQHVRVPPLRVRARKWRSQGGHFKAGSCGWTSAGRPNNVLEA